MTIFVTATGTGVGKTYTTLKIMEIFCDLGIKAAPLKPIETGVADTPQDATALLQKYLFLYGESLTLDEVCPYRFALAAAPFVAKGSQNIDLIHINNAIKKLLTKADVVIIEGAGGLFTPIEKDFFMIDLAMRADFTVLISHVGLGCINDALMSTLALKNRQIAHALIFNRRENDEFDSVSKPFFTQNLQEVLELKDLKTVLERLQGLFF